LIQCWRVAIYCIGIVYIPVYIYVHEIVQMKKREREKIQVLYILPHIQWHAGDVPRRGECRGLVETPCLYMFIPGVARYIASQLYPETPSLTYYLQYMRIPCHHIHLCEVLSPPTPTLISLVNYASFPSFPLCGHEQLQLAAPFILHE